MIRILKKILIKKIQFLSFFSKPKKKITFIRKYYSGSNVTPVFEKMKNEKDIEVELIHNHPDDMNILNQSLLYLKLLKSKVIVTTHGVSFKTRKNITVDLWHGKSLKAMNLMNPSEKRPRVIKEIDYLASYSKTVDTLFNACFGMRSENYKILGSPRNDYLFQKEGEAKKRKILNCQKDEKIIFYMPTYREYMSEGYNQFIKNFSFEKFSLEDFNKFLQKENIRFVLKPHPVDNRVWRGIFKEKNLSNFTLLTEETLAKNNIELYELLAISDMLITDYSSVSMDYLLTDKPMLFIPTDLEKYDKERSLLLKPYDFWAPGPKCFNQKDLEREIVKSFKEKDYFKKERDIVKKIFHKYTDGNSTERTVEFLKSLVN